jgi:hypothetical protein
MDTMKLNPVVFNPKPYRREIHLFNIHSWAPFFYDVSEIMSAFCFEYNNLGHE